MHSAVYTFAGNQSTQKRRLGPHLAQSHWGGVESRLDNEGTVSQLYAGSGKQGFGDQSVEGGAKTTPDSGFVVLDEVWMKRSLICAGGIFIWLLGCPAFGETTISFARLQAEPNVEGSPLAMAAGDVDGDGLVDLVVTRTDLDEVAILFGNGDGSFLEPPSVYDMDPAQNPRSLLLADFNGDRHLDIITANELSDNVTVMLNDGTGVFSPPVESPVGSFPAEVAVGDFDRDGKLDVATASQEDDTVTILLGNGDGTFKEGTAIPVGAEPSSLVAVDLDGDGFIDLVVTNASGGVDSSGSLSILRGLGDGTFDAQPEFLTDALLGPVAVRAADLDEDGKLDIVVLNQESGDVAVFSGTGTLTPGNVSSIPVTAFPNAMVIEDLNGDGFLDIATTSEFENNVAVLLGGGDGSFAPFVQFDVGESPYGIVSADFNGDRKLDLATANQDAETISILINDTGVIQVCGGDCDSDGEVTVDELVRMVNIALELFDVSVCTPGDMNGDGAVTIDEIIAGVNNALNGCSLL